MNRGKRAIWGWAIYDWANSAFATTVMAGLFPVFFKQYWSAGYDASQSTALLGLANSLAGILVAICAPILGAVADLCSLRKRFLLTFAFLGGALHRRHVPGGKRRVAVGRILLCAGRPGVCRGQMCFTTRFFPRWPLREDLDRVSALGYALGYLGGRAVVRT